METPPTLFSKGDISAADVRQRPIVTLYDGRRPLSMDFTHRYTACFDMIDRKDIYLTIPELKNPATSFEKAFAGGIRPDQCRTPKNTLLSPLTARPVQARARPQSSWRSVWAYSILTRARCTGP